MGGAVPYTENYYQGELPDPRDALRRRPRFKGLLEYRRSLRALRRQSFDMILPGFGGVIRVPDRAIRDYETPVLAIWGSEDSIIPLSSMGDLAQLNRAARQEVIEGAGHGLTYTHSDEVIHAMRDLMRD